MPEQVHDCVESVLEDNPGMDESQAWAICQAEYDAADGELATRDELDVDAEALDELAAESEDWEAVDGGWLNTEENLAVFGGLEEPDDVDEQTVTIEGLSQEAIADIESRYNATVVDGVGSAAPTDHESRDE